MDHVVETASSFRSDQEILADIELKESDMTAFTAHDNHTCWLHSDAVAAMQAIMTTGVFLDQWIDALVLATGDTVPRQNRWVLAAISNAADNWSDGAELQRDMDHEPCCCTAAPLPALPNQGDGYDDLF